MGAWWAVVHGVTESDRTDYSEVVLPGGAAQGNSHFCGFVGRRDGKNFVMDHNAVMGKYGSRMKINCRLPAALASAMGDQIYIANVETQEELDTFFSDLLAEC